MSVDPLTASYPWYTPYQFAGNKPIVAVDLDGLEEKEAVTAATVSTGKAALKKTTTEAVKRTTVEYGKRLAVNSSGELIKQGLNISAKAVGTLFSAVLFVLTPTGQGESSMMASLDGYEKETFRRLSSKAYQDLTPEERSELDYLWSKYKWDENGEVVDNPNFVREFGSTDAEEVIERRYVNPGHHDPKGGKETYKANKSVLPENHEELWEKSVEDPSNPNVRWSIEKKGKKKVIHRFQSDQKDGSGEWHWNGSTDGKTKSGKPNKIQEQVIPNEIKKG